MEWSVNFLLLVCVVALLVGFFYSLGAWLWGRIAR